MKKKTYYHIILDQSGSMQDCIDPTISGFNEQVQVVRSLQQRYPEQEIRIGLTCFNDDVNIVSFARPVNEQRQLNRETYRPDGSTALYDAIGQTVLKIKDSIGNGALQSQDDVSMIVVILTDGYENASKLFNRQGIGNLIRELEATGKWTFTYLGATIDAQEILDDLVVLVAAELVVAVDLPAAEEAFARHGRFEAGGERHRAIVLRDAALLDVGGGAVSREAERREVGRGHRLLDVRGQERVAAVDGRRERALQDRRVAVRLEVRVAVEALHEQLRVLGEVEIEIS
ncbi:MAG: VWA domain-containing protein, partial [Chitinophagaceae bacterium]